MFRDSRGVVHTVSSADPLEDLPAEAAATLAAALLVPPGGDLGGALERCDAVRTLIDRWQDAFFAALPSEIDLEEEARWAAESGLSLEDVEGTWDEDDDDESVWDVEPDQSPGQIGLDEIDLSELSPLDDEPEGLFDLEPVSELEVLGDALVSELERALLLLPLRVRLEALVAAATVVDSWADLLADHEKCLGHLVLRHGPLGTVELTHEALVEEHVRRHAGHPGHELTT